LVYSHPCSDQALRRRTLSLFQVRPILLLLLFLLFFLLLALFSSIASFSLLFAVL